MTETQTPETTIVSLNPIRKAIADRMVLSKTTIPHAYVVMDIDMTAAMRFREEFNAGGHGNSNSLRISVNDLVVKAAALALRQVPALNAWCGVPLRAAAATSAVMIGITAVSSAPVYYSRGLISPPLAAAAVVGVLLGSRAGFWFGGRAKAKWLKLLMSAVLGSVSVTYLVKAMQ